MIDHIISLRCTRGGGATPSPPSLRTTKQPSTPFLVAAAGRTRPTTGAPLATPPGAQPPEDPGPVQRRQRHLLLPHCIRRPGEEVQTRMPVGPGKRVGHRELITLGGGMIFLQDDESKQQFTVNTGAVCSVLPHFLTVQKHRRLALSFSAPTGEPFHAGGLSAAAYRSGCAPFSSPFCSPPYTEPSSV